MTIARIFRDQGINIFQLLRTKDVKRIKLNGTTAKVELRK